MSTAKIEELQITRTIAGVIMDLYSADEVELEVDVRISGSYTPARVDGPPENCYEAEYPDVEFVGAITVESAAMLNEAGDFVMFLPARTEVGHELDRAQTAYLEEVAYEEATA